MSHGNKDNAISRNLHSRFLETAPTRDDARCELILRVARLLNYCAIRLEHEREINETDATVIDSMILTCNTTCILNIS